MKGLVNQTQADVRLFSKLSITFNLFINCQSKLVVAAFVSYTEITVSENKILAHRVNEAI